MTKSVGGRGHKAENKYERLTVTMPPELLERLDALAARRGISRSEALTIAASTGLKFIREKKQV